MVFDDPGIVKRCFRARISPEIVVPPWEANGKIGPFSQSVCLSKRDCYYVSFSNARPTVSANIPVYVKEKGGPTRSKFVQTVRLFSQLQFKAHDVGGLGHDHQSGILWPGYPL